MFYIYLMKKIIVLLILPILIYSQPASKKLRVLFIGNSYTYVNNLPQLVHDIARSNGDSLLFDSYCPGGYTFNNHFNDANTLAKIALGNWNYVVLQAQSQEPSFSPGQVSAQTLPYAVLLDSVIKFHNPCATTVLYETWGRKFGDPSNCASYPPVCTYSGMQNRLRDSYKLFADTCHGIMAPAGEAFRQVVSTNTLIDLYQADQSHPSLEGSYLTACVFYETLFQKSVLTSTYNPGIATATVSYFNLVAHNLVADSASTWNINKYIPKASMTVTPQGPSSFQFQSGPSPFLKKWFFGDGSFSVLSNPTHTYTNAASYTVSLLVYDFLNCKKDSISTTVIATQLTGIDVSKTLENLGVFPNPASEVLHLSVGDVFANAGSFVEISDISGRIIYRTAYAEELNIGTLQKGLYFIRVFTNLAQANSCFIKNE